MLRFSDAVLWNGSSLFFIALFYYVTISILPQRTFCFIYFLTIMLEGIMDILIFGEQQA